MGAVNQYCDAAVFSQLVDIEASPLSGVWLAGAGPLIDSDKNVRCAAGECCAVCSACGSS